MKKIILFSAAFLLTTTLHAATSSTTQTQTTNTSSQKATTQKATTHQTAQKIIENTMEVKPRMATVNIYATPNTTAAVVKKVSPNANLVAIFRQKDWMKVGDRTNGATGWINLAQYHEAKKAFYKEYFRNAVNSLYINVKKTKDGKLDIEAYRDGKKLSDAEATKLYAKMQAQEQRQWEVMQADYANAQRAIDEAFLSPMIAMPGVVIIQNPTFNKSNGNASTSKASTLRS